MAAYFSFLELYLDALLPPHSADIAAILLRWSAPLHLVEDCKSFTFIGMSFSFPYFLAVVNIFDEDYESLLLLLISCPFEFEDRAYELL